MGAVFVFVDDSGQYVDREASDKSLRRHPFYVRAGVMVPASQFWQLRHALEQARQGLPVELAPEGEVKWSHIHAARIELQRDGIIADGRNWSYLRGCTADDLERYPGALLSGVSGLHGCKVVVTVSRSGVTRHLAEDILRWHLQSLMQRVQMDIYPAHESVDDVAVLVADEESEKHDLSQKDLAEFYRLLRQQGDAYNRFDNLNDALYFVDSKQSAGVQVADVVAGCCYGALRGQAYAVKLWRKHVWPMLRKLPDGRVAQIGIVAVPSAEQLGTGLDPLFE